MSKKNQKPKNKQMIPGDHKLSFYIDEVSGHPFMRISKYKNRYYGHNVTDSPSRKKNGDVRSGYVRFRKNPKPKTKKVGYYRKKVDIIIQDPNKDDRLSLKRTWSISNRDLRRLRRQNKNRIKSIHK